MYLAYHVMRCTGKSDRKVCAGAYFSGRNIHREASKTIAELPHRYFILSLLNHYEDKILGIKNHGARHMFMISLYNHRRIFISDDSEKFLDMLFAESIRKDESMTQSSRM